MRYKSRTRALAGAALAATLGLAGLAFTASPAMAVEDTDVVRVAGTTRYGTAADAATSAYPDGSANVVLASGEKFPDALAGGGLAGSLDAPILLTQEGNLPADTIAALAELDAETVTILGGTDAISAAVEAELVALGYATDRVAGLDRFETAADIAAELGGTTAVLANGLRFPDALAISPGAHALELPVLLTLADSLHEDAAAYIDANAVDTVVIVGGTAVVSQDIEDALEADGITVVRLAGDTRYETSVEIAEFHVTQGFTLDRVVMATGENFADALAGGPYAAELGAPMVLTQTATLTPATATFLTENCLQIDALSILGGTAAITQDVEDAAAAAAQCDVQSATDAPELIAADYVRTNASGDHIYRFTFDEGISPVLEDGTTDAIDETLFHVHSWNGENFYGTSAAQDPSNDSAVLVVFTGADISPDRVARAAVDAGAVIGHTDDPNDNPDLGPLVDDDDTNVEGYAHVQDISFAAGETDSPDLMQVSNLRLFNSAANGWHIRADFTFDQAAYDDGACSGNMALFLAQPGTAQGTSTWGDNRLVSDSCVGDPDGQTTWTVIFDTDGEGTAFANEAAAQAALDLARRGHIADDSYESVDGVEGVSRNVVIAGTDGLTEGPNLTGAEIVRGVQQVGAGAADPTYDAVDLTFDEAVDIIEDWAPCTVYKRFADEPIWGYDAEHPGTDESVVRCYFDLGELDELVAGTVHGGSFVASQADGFYAAPGEVRFGSLDLEPDTTAPTLVDTAVTQTDEVVYTDPITNVETVRGREFVVVFTFDRDLDAVGGDPVVSPADFGLYFVDGERRDMTTCVYGDSDNVTAGSGDDNQVICLETEGDLTEPPVAGAAADDLGDAVLGGVASESVESADFDGAMNHAASAA